MECHLHIRHILLVNHPTIVSLKYKVLIYYEIYFFSLIDAPPPPPVLVYAQPIPVIRPLGGLLGHYPQATQCPLCGQSIVTNVRYEAGGGTWLIAFLIFILGGFLGCCFIPFCVSSCQEAVHICPSCHVQIGRHSPF